MKLKSILFILIIIFVAGSIYYLESQKVSPASFDTDISTESSSKASAESPLTTGDVSPPALKENKYPLAPELEGITGYINTEEGKKLADFRGKVVLVDFWTYSCINCIRTLPYLTAWDKKYKDNGLVIIGVHTPEFNFEKEKENVVESMNKYNVEYIVVQDNNYATWRAYKNRFWPHKYLIDADGYIRYDHIGEGGYAETENKIQQLLAEIDQDVSASGLSKVIDRTPLLPTTPEIYAGYDFAIPRLQNIGNEGGFKVDKEFNYIKPESMVNNVVYLQGPWYSSSENLQARGSSQLFLHFTGSSVNIVAMADSVVELEVLIDGKYVTSKQAGEDVKFDGLKSFVEIREPRLYNLVDGPYSQYVLELKTTEGFSFNAFTFG